MRFLACIEKKKFTWVLIVLCVAFFFLRLPSLIEPYWYGDEGVYEVIGQAMDQGRLLYQDIWDNKPPLLYTIYAIAQGDQQVVETISAFFGILAIIGIFILTQNLFNKTRISILSSLVFVLLLGTPLLEGNIANAEVFMLPFTIFAGLLIYQHTTQTQNNSKQSSIFNLQSLIFIAGLLLGIAFLFKIVAIFDFAAFFLFLLINRLPEKLSWKSFKKAFAKKHLPNALSVWKQPQTRIYQYIIVGFFLPFILTVIYFFLNHSLVDFLQAVFLGNVDYVAWGNSLFGLSNGLLLLKIVILVIGLSVIIWKRKQFSKPALFIWLWILFSIFSAFFSERPYTHYVIVLLPSFCLLFGLIFTEKNIRSRLIAAVGIIAILVITSFQFQFNVPKSIAYYHNAIQFVKGSESVETYQSFFDTKTPRDYMVATFINDHTSPSENVFIWGDSPQIYALSHKLPPGKYTVAYHISQNNAVNQTQIAINRAKPKYIIALSEAQPLPFDLPLYIMRYNISGATIYERSF
ncbi:MAG TPA: glycosyltransferase family 39 protein [Candidatus Acidoferrales bacterium]|nr:glycosyltransferase family 39 protein [Candidatus Acidoferrales bacterium]